jgi:hypothetical protein
MLIDELTDLQAKLIIPSLQRRFRTYQNVQICVQLQKFSVQLFKAQWLLYLPIALTYQNITFCPQSVFVCSIWFSQ